MSDYQIIVGDCLHVLRGMDPGSVQCCATSPPFFGLRDYGLPPSEWPAVSYAPMPGLPPVEVPAMACCLGLEPDPMAFVGHLVLIWRELRRVLRDDGTCWLNLGSSYAREPQKGDNSGWGKHATIPDFLPGHSRAVPNGLKPKDLILIPSMAALALEADGWYLRAQCPWVKRNAMPGSQEDRPTVSHEEVFLLTKQPTYFYDADAVKRPHARLWGENNGGSWAHASRTDEFAMTKGAAGVHRGKGYPLPDPAGRTLRTADFFFDSLREILAGENMLLSGDDGDPVAFVVNPQGNPNAHFATFPPDLVRPMLLAGTSQAGACPACGAPWQRVVEREKAPRRATMSVASRDANSKPQGRLTTERQDEPDRTTTTGWRPTCACIQEKCPPCEMTGREWLDLADAIAQEMRPVPCRVLDPFCGSGTTGRVARQLGLEFVGIEANPEYAEMARAGIEAYHKAIPRPARVNAEQPALLTL